MSTPTPDWQSASFIRDELARQASPEGRTNASIFLDASVADDDVNDVVARLVADACVDGQTLKLGKIRSLSKSFSVEGEPDTIARLIGAREVTSVLPSSVKDVYPKPVDVRDVE